MPPTLPSRKSKRLAVFTAAVVVVATLALALPLAQSSARSRVQPGVELSAQSGVEFGSRSIPDRPYNRPYKRPMKRPAGRTAITKPVVTKPVATTPVTSATVPTVPVATSPVASGTVATSPVTSGPATTKPVTSGTVATSPVTSGTVATSPVTSGPAITGPAITRPVTTIPMATMPVTSGPAVTAPLHAPALVRLTSGSGRSAVLNNSGPPGPEANHGNRIYCVVSHFSYDDPIVYPGQPGAAHAHMFWGNTATDYASTGASIQTTGNSSCEGGINNRSAYWTPVLFNSANEAVLPERVIVYYKTFGGPGFDRSTIRPIPSGLEILATRSVPNAGEWNFRREGSATTVELMVQFPTCLQVDASGAPVLSSADNVSHVSYPSGSGPSNCPASHPYRIPQVIFALTYAVPFDSAWSLSSDTPGMAKGASLHADYVAAWDDDTMRRLVECNISNRSCDFAGGRGQLAERFVGPDGAVIYENSVQLASGADRTPFGTTITKHARSHGPGHH